jgi:hypothetical protein
MQDFAVSLDVLSDVLSLSELCSLLQHSPDHGSHSRGDLRAANLGVFDETIWSLYSKAPATAPLQEHLTSIRSRFPPERLRALAGADSSSSISSVVIDIAIFFDAEAFSANVILSRHILHEIEEYGADVRVICYPCSEDTED